MAAVKFVAGNTAGAQAELNRAADHHAIKMKDPAMCRAEVMQESMMRSVPGDPSAGYHAAKEAEARCPPHKEKEDK